MAGETPRAPRWRRVALLVAIDAALVALVLLAAELAVRVRTEGSLGAAWASLVGGEVRLAEEGDSDWLEPHPALGYRLNTDHGPVSSIGIRHGELDPAFAGYRLVVLGDSVSWDQDGWVAFLREELARGRGGAVEVVNAAIPGYTTHQERLLFESGLAPAGADVVLLQVCLNDNHRFLHELTDDGRWLVRQEARRVLVPSGGWLVDGLTRRSRLVFEARKHLYLARERDEGFFPWDSSPDFAPAWRLSSWDAQRRELRLLRDAVRGAGARLAVVVVPYEPQLGTKYLDRDRDYVLLPQRELARACAELSVPLLDVHGAFFEERDEPLYRPGDPVHLSDHGHRVLAGEVEAFLEREGLLPGSDGAASD